MIVVSIGLFMITSIVYWVRTKSMFNPVSLLCWSFLGSMVSVLVISTTAARPPTYSDHVMRILSNAYLVSFAGFMMSWVLYFLVGHNSSHSARRTVHVPLPWKERSRIRATVLLLDKLIIMAIIVGSLIMGVLPLVKMLKGNLNIAQSNVLSRVLPTGLAFGVSAFGMVLSIYLAECLRDSLRHGVSAKLMWTSYMVAILSSVWKGQRQGVLFILFVTVAALLSRHGSRRWRVKTIIWIVIMLLGFIGMFNGIQLIRLHGQGYSSLQPILYGEYPAMNLVTAIQSVSVEPSLNHAPRVLFLELVPNRSVARTSAATAMGSVSLYEPTSSSGYLLYWYLDYGWLGILLGGVILGVAARLAYRKRNRSQLWRGVYYLILWCCATVSIYSHLLALAFFWGPIILLGIFSYASRVRLHLASPQRDDS